MRRKTSIEDILGTKRWEALGRLEAGYKTKYLRGLSERESLRVFKELYEFAVRTADRRYLNSIDPAKLKSIIRVRSLLAAVR
jgi:hypothetical protein